MKKVIIMWLSLIKDFIFVLKYILLSYFLYIYYYKRMKIVEGVKYEEKYVKEYMIFNI